MRRRWRLVLAILASAVVQGAALAFLGERLSLTEMLWWFHTTFEDPTPTWVTILAAGGAVLIGHRWRGPASAWTVTSLGLTLVALVNASFVFSLPLAEIPGRGLLPRRSNVSVPAILFGVALVCGAVGLIRSRPPRSWGLVASALLLPAPCAFLYHASIELQRFDIPWKRGFAGLPHPEWTHEVVDGPDPDMWNPTCRIEEDGSVWVEREKFFDPEAPDGHRLFHWWLTLVVGRMKKSHDAELDRAVPSERIWLRASRDAAFEHVLPVVERCWHADIRVIAFAARGLDAEMPRPPLFRWRLPAYRGFEIPFPRSGPVAADGVESHDGLVVLRFAGSTPWAEVVRAVEEALVDGAGLVALGLEG